MKIMVAGSYNWEIYEEAISRGFENLGHEVIRFNWNKNNCSKVKLVDRIEERFLLGGKLKKLNKKLLSSALTEKPKFVFIYRGTHIYAKTVDKIRREGIMVFEYNNDDPFSRIPSQFYWRHYLKNSMNCNHNFVYRKKNLVDFEKIGVLNTSVLKSYYIKEKNFPLPLKVVPKNFRSDVVFIGHYEDDGRDEYINRLLEIGVNVKIYGDISWKQSKYYHKFSEKLGEIVRLDEKYNTAINGAKIVLVFLSKINSDTYTRRCFEIPACKKFMLSEFTDDLANMYCEGEEVEFFRNITEFEDKVKFYLAHDDKREQIAENGYNAVREKGHEVTNRAQQVINVYNKMIRRNLNE